MPHTLASLCRAPNGLSPFYSSFRVSERLLFTGHSHQAWPDCARAGLGACFDDAALCVDDKWERAFAKAERVREGFRAWLGEPRAEIALGQSTHELVVRFLSALPLRTRPRLVTSDAEFHSLRRQLERLSEEGIEVVRVAAQPVDTLAERLSHALAQDGSRTSAVLVSSVLFTTSEIVPHLAGLAASCAHHGAELLIDAYHQLGILPLSMRGLEGAFVVGGGYKYLQLGEGNCFLRLPPGRALRPVITGWFAEFEWLDRQDRPSAVPYAEGAQGFSGSTYDPASHYRASEVLDFFVREGLTPGLLREVSQHQLRVLARGVEALDLDPDLLAPATHTPLDQRGGFLALRSPRAHELGRALARRGVTTDQRGSILRLGPAPYVHDGQIDAAVAALAESLRSME